MKFVIITILVIPILGVLIVAIKLMFAAIGSSCVFSVWECFNRH